MPTFQSRDEIMVAATLQGSGEMADLVRKQDWSRTPLGPMESWSETLRSTVNLLLLSPFSFALYWGPEYTLIYNDTYRPFLGEKHPQALGDPGQNVWPEAWPIIGQPIVDAMQTGHVTNSAEVFIPVTLGGELQDRWWTYCFYPVYENNRIAGVVNIGFDNTPAVLARRSLTQSEALSSAISERLTQVLDVTTDAIVSVNRNWVMTYFNPKAQSLYAADRNELLGRTVWEAFPDAAYEGSPFVEHYHRAMNEGVSATFEAHYPDPLNTWLCIEVHPTRDGIVIFSRDVSKQKLTAAALMQSEKLAAVGRLASSIAHEINNPLESVTNLLFLARTSEDPAQIQEYLAIAERELLRVSVISNQTLRFYKQSTSPRAVSCTDLFSTILSVYQGRLVNSRVQVEKRKRASFPIKCFEGEIRQVLSNLVGNAIDAMHYDGGRLILGSRETTHWKTGEKGIALTVADTGTGMSAQVRRRAFEAFYTTKGIGGTGLGLWLSQEIVDRHQGTLSVRSSQAESHRVQCLYYFCPSTP